MAQYTLIDPATGEWESFSEVELTRNLWMNYILFREDEHLGIITHRDLVAFARWCAGELSTRVKEPPDHRVTKALALVDRWLEDEVSFSNEELEAAAEAAWAADAAWAARTADADAAEAAVWAAEAAAEAAEAAALAVAARVATAHAAVAGAAADAAADADAAEAATYEAAIAHANAVCADDTDARVAAYEAQAQWLAEHLQSGK